MASGTSLALVGDYNELYFSHQISDDKAQRLQVGQEAEFIFPGREFKNMDWTHREMEAEHAFHGVLTGIAPPLEVPGAARTLLWRIDNPLGLLMPQTYGTAFLKMAQGTDGKNSGRGGLCSGEFPHGCPHPPVTFAKSSL